MGTDGPRTGRPRIRLALAIAILCGGVMLLAGSAAEARKGAPLVRIADARLDKDAKPVVVTARVFWNRPAIDAEGMFVGDLRLVAIDGGDGRARVLASSSSAKLRKEPVQAVRFKLVSSEDLKAIEAGNRVVLTASQHARTVPDVPTPKTFVTVAALQKGPTRKVGVHDCSDRPVVARADLEGCDLAGASLKGARVGKAGARTELLKADLAGADLRDADLSDVDLAAARVSGVDATGARITGVSLAKAEGVGFVAHDTKIEASNIFDASMTDANFEGSHFTGTSLSRSRFTKADFAGADITGAITNGASFEGASLRRTTLSANTYYFTDFTDASLRDATLDATPEDLMWALLCRTELPNGTIENRDCTGKRGRRHGSAAAAPFVTVDATLHKGENRATIDGKVTWNRDAVEAEGMKIGEVRAIAVDADTGVPTVVGETGPRRIDPADPSDRIHFEIEGDAKLKALEGGNRVVVTASQHPPHPEPPAAGDDPTPRSYVTVDQLQAGPDRGRVGKVDCSDRPIRPGAAADALRFCDLVGAALGDADLSNDDLRIDDLTGADLRGANLSGAKLDGSRLGGVRAGGARLDSTSLIAVKAPALEIRSTRISSATFFGSALRGARFDGSSIFSTSFATAALGGGASFAGSKSLNRVDFGYAMLGNADLSGVKANQSSLFLADLTDATLRSSDWSLDEEGRDPPRSAILCRTTMPNGDVSSRDCTD